MRNALGQHEGRHQMSGRPCLPAVRSQDKSAHPSLPEKKTVVNTQSVKTLGNTQSIRTPGDTQSIRTPGDTQSIRTPGDTQSIKTPGNTQLKKKNLEILSQ